MNLQFQTNYEIYITLRLVRGKILDDSIALMYLIRFPELQHVSPSLSHFRNENIDQKKRKLSLSSEIMSSSLYRNFLKLLEKWPTDTSKKGRDLGEYIRQQIALNFKQGELSKVDEKVWQANYDSLSKIANNHYKEKFPVSKVGTATGLTPEQCKEIISTEFLQLLRTGKY